MDDILGIVHVQILVAVVAHEAKRVLPAACILIVGVADDLVDEDRSVGLAAGREATYAHIGAIVAEQARAFAIVEHTEEVVAHVALGLAEGVLALEAEQEVVGRIVAPVAGKHAVVPCSVAKKQQIAGHIGLARCAVVEHLQIAAIGIGIGSATRELVEKLVGRHYAHTKAVALLVQLLQPLGLGKEFLGGGNEYHHVDCLIGMVVLIGDAIDILRNRQ